jgi:hypothetical protein
MTKKGTWGQFLHSPILPVSAECGKKSWELKRNSPRDCTDANRPTHVSSMKRLDLILSDDAFTQNGDPNRRVIEPSSVGRSIASEFRNFSGKL